MYCTHCGQPLDPVTRGCRNCGLTPPDPLGTPAAAAPPPLPPQPPPAKPRRPIWKALALVVLCLVGLTVAVAAIGAASSTDTNRPGAAGPAGPSVDDRVAAAIGIDGPSYRARYTDYEYKLDLYWEYTNNTLVDITAWQFLVDAEATDQLGRSFSQTFQVDCTGSPLHPGERRSSTSKGADTPGNALTDLQNCTLTVYGMNQFIDQQIGLWKALHEGNTLKVRIRPTVVTFPDGTQLGTPRS